MAATLNADQEQLVHFSFPIEKQEDTDSINPVDGTPDIWIVGKATDGTVDADRQIVDPQWSAVALKEWAATGGNVRMSHDPRRPVGKGHDVQVTMDGHFVKSLISDPLAKHFVRTGVLNDYSVGISMPHIKFGADKNLDPNGKATGGIITGRPDGLSKIAELSIVDRGANFSSRFQITRKSAGDGDDFGFDGQMVGSQEEIIKAAPADLLAKISDGDLLTKAAPADDDFVNVDLPRGASISISPADFAKLHTFKQQLVTKAAEPDVEKRDVDTAERRDLAGEGNALPDGSYPIKNTGDLDNAAHLARTGHGDVAAARRLIARRAGELGVANPLDESDEANKSEGLSDKQAGEVLKALQDVMLSTGISDAPAEAVKEAEPEVTKDPEEAKDKPVKKAKKKPKKLPPWLNKPKDGDDGDDGKDDDSCKSAHTWTLVGSGDVPDIVCEKCHTTPAEAAGLSATHDMTAAPVPELLESPPMASTKSSPTPESASGASEAPAMDPVPAHREPDGAIVEPFEKDASLPSEGQGETPTRIESGMMKQSPEVAAFLRFKKAGIDVELGRLHDMTCPAYHPDEVAKYHPFTDFRNVDEGYFQRKAVEAACGPDMEASKSLTLVMQAAHVLKTTDPAELNDFRLEAHKAFRDANPGPNSAPTPGMITPGKYNRPLITDGHETSSPAHDGPNTSPAVATSPPNAMHFDRPPLAAGHQSPSPSFMKASFEYPSEQGRPTQINYAVMEKERARHALMQVHEHLSRQFPEACPMTLEATPLQPESRGVPPTAGIGKSADDSVPALLDGGFVVPAPVAASLKAPADGEFVDDAVYKGFKKMRKKLGKKVLAGSITVDEARAKMGRQFAQKDSGGGGNAQKGFGPMTPILPVPVDEPAVPAEPRQWQYPVGGIEGVIAAEKAAVADVVTKAMAPLLERLEQQDKTFAEERETFHTRLAEQQKVIDAIADQPDPSTAAFSGLAFNPLQTKSRRPAGVTEVAEAAERAQHMVMRTLQDKYNASSDPAEREAYYGTLAKMRGVST